MSALPVEGERLRSKFNGREFVVMFVGERIVVVEALDNSIRLATNIDNIFSFYEWVTRRGPLFDRDFVGDRYQKMCGA